MHVQAIIFSLMLGLFPLIAIAGAGHNHSHSHNPVSQSQAEEIAIKSVSKLLEKGKIDSSWKSIKVTHTKKENFGGNMEWVVTFKNENISDPAKQTLYVFLTLGGEYLGANYTGK